MTKFTKYFGWLMGAVGTVLGIIGIVQLFMDEALWLKIVIVASIFIGIFFAALIITIISSKRNRNLIEGFVGDKSIMIQENKKYLTNMYKDHEYNDVCNIGMVFSRVFYIAAAYKSRYEIGVMIFMSASQLKRDKLCATCLLDTGWTALLLGSSIERFEYDGIDYDSPDDFFKQSIVFAEKINDNSLISKAYRHLCGYYLTIGNYAEAQKCREKSGEYLEKMPNGTDKDRLLSNLLYTDAETAFLQHNYIISQELCVKADELKQGVDDDTREIRYYAQHGKILLMLENIPEAKKLFTQGLDSAKRIKRLDEITKNTYGYAICLIHEGQKHEAENLVKSMRKKYKDIPLFISDEFFKTEYARLLKILKNNNG